MVDPRRSSIADVFLPTERGGVVEDRRRRLVLDARGSASVPAADQFCRQRGWSSHQTSGNYDERLETDVAADGLYFRQGCCGNIWSYQINSLWREWPGFRLDEGIALA